MIPEFKICGRCGIEKTASEFPLRKKKNGYTWLRLQCSKCMNEIKKEFYIRNKAKVIKRNAEYTSQNKDKVYKRQQEWRKDNQVRIKKERREKYLVNSESVKKRRKNYYYKNKQKVIDLNTNYVERNKVKVRARQRIHHAKKKKEDLAYSILKILRTRVSAAIRHRGVKCKRTMDLVGCTMPELMAHLESKFKDGMRWDNYGYYGWHVDHIIPCASFNMLFEEQQKECFNYTNLQPLWWLHNLKKGSKIDYELANYNP